jgi:small subunit ribosomal protein S9
MAEAKKKTTKKVAPKKTVAKKAPAKKVAAPRTPATKSGSEYIYAVGRRKTASVQARIYMNTKTENAVNGRPLEKYFGTASLLANVLAPVKAVGMEEKVSFTLLAQGGGISGQSDAAKLALARALVKHDALLRPTLKAAGFLTRDARKVERKKPGLKKARRAPQWAKR